MKLNKLFIPLLIIGLFAYKSNAQTDNAEVDVTVFESVLSTASWANFKYKDQLALAKKGDQKALTALLDFSGTVDGRAALDHSVTLLELIVSTGDNAFSLAVKSSKAKLKSILLDRLQLAQGRTKKEELRQPMHAWAPMTWAALNNKVYVPAGQAKGLGDTGHKQSTTTDITCDHKSPDKQQPIDTRSENPDVQVITKPKGKE